MIGKETIVLWKKMLHKLNYKFIKDIKSADLVNYILNHYQIDTIIHFEQSRG